MTDKLLEFLSSCSDKCNREIVNVNYEDCLKVSDKESPEEILRENIRKANKFLDLALEDVMNGSITSLYVERVSKLIDSITLAAEKLMNATDAAQEFELRRELLSLKRRELELKNKNVPNSLTQNIVMTYKDALSLIRNKNQED